MTSQQTGGVLRPAMILTVAIVAGWIVCFWPARMLRGSDGILWMSVAAGCCLVPGWAVVFLSRLSVFPNDLAAMLVQMTVRLTFVGAAAVIVKKFHPDFGPLDFTGWLIAFYLLALFVEVWLMHSSASDSSSSGGQDDKSHS